MWKPTISLSLVALLAGCATAYDARTAPKQASFAVVGASNSSSTTFRNAFAWVFADEECSAGKRGTLIKGEMGNAALPPPRGVPIAAEETFVFTAVYIEARMGQTRQCALTGSFLPMAGHRYTARVVASGEVGQCWLGVYDVTSGTEEKADFSMPPHACQFNDAKSPNGQPLWTLYRYRFTTTPAK